MTDTDVVVVGAGPAGLAATIELGTRGVRVLLIEQNERGGAAPRAKTTNVRTRTHLRRWGIADKLADASPFGVDYPNSMVFVTSLAGHELARFPNAFNASPERDDRYPEHGQWIPQYKLEQVMLDKVRALPSVTLRFGVTFESASQDEDQVTAKLRSADGEESVTARYLIGADGARSIVRDGIGAKLEGRHGMSHSYNIIFLAPGMAEAHAHGPAAIYWQLGTKGLSAVGPMDEGDKWFFVPAGAAPGTSLPPGEARALIVERTGIDLPYEILSADSWSAHDLLANRYMDGRIMLAGDAAHLHPPFGGYGMNMGVGDGVDLGWKIAATLQGWGGPGLVPSYETERRPVHRAVIDEALANYAIAGARLPEALEDDSEEGAAIRARIGAGVQASKGREFYTLGTVLGLGYENSPLISKEDGPPPPHVNEVYTPTARPGHLAPHAWLPDGRSLYDLFGDGFSLIAASEADRADVARAETDAREAGIPLTIVKPESIDVRTLYGAALALVRPDQHVAWRGERWKPVFPLVTGVDTAESAAA